MSSEKLNEAYLNKSLQRALSILGCFSAEERRLSLRELSERLQIHRASVYRLAANLVSEGFMQYDDKTGQYSLGLRLLELGALVLSDMNLPVKARPYMEALRDQTEETVQLGIIDGGDVVYIAHFESPQPIKLSGAYGSRWPLYATAMGRVLLTGLPPAEAEGRLRASGPLPARTPHTVTDPAEVMARVREVSDRGYAYDDQETETGLRCIAAPVRDHDGRVVAAIGISGPTFRLKDDTLAAFAGAVAGAALRISREIGFSGDAPGLDRPPSGLRDMNEPA